MVNINFDAGFLQRAAAGAVQAGQQLSSQAGGSSFFYTAAAAVVGLAAVAGLNSLLNNYALGNPLFPFLSPRDKSWDWSREIVLVTGGSSGLGRIMVTEFARRGIKVVVLDRQPPLEEEGEDESGRFPGQDEGVWFYQFDLTGSDAALQALAARIRRDVGGEPTVLINNAGIGHGLPLLDTSPELLRAVFAVNAVAPLLLTREFLPSMIRNHHGHVVNIASMASFVTIASNIDYSCTKASLLAFHEGLTQELRHRYHAPEVRTTVVHPFWTRTPMLGAAAADSADDRKRYKGTVLDAQYVAGAVVDQVLSGRSGQLILPPRLFVAAWVRALPPWLQEHIRSQQATILERPL